MSKKTSKVGSSVKKNVNISSNEVPTLTICLPTYDRPKLLENCLNHLLSVASTVGYRFEVLVYDSSPDERSKIVVEAFKKKITNEFEFVYLHRDFSHVLWKVYAAVNNASGKYFMYLADDDYLLPENLNLALQKLESEPQLSAYFATWQLWNDETGQIVNKTNDQGLNWMTSEARTYTINDVLALADEVVVRTVCPEIYIMRTDVARNIMMDWRSPDEQIAIFFLMRTLRFGSVHISNTPFYRYTDIRKTSLLDGQKDSQAHYGELLYKEAPFMTRFSREWFVAQAFREAGHDFIPEKIQQTIFKSINFEYIQRLKGNGLFGVHHKEYQLAHRYLSTAASWNPGIYPKQEIYALEQHYIVPYSLQTIENVIKNTRDVQKIQIFGFTDANHVVAYFENKAGDPNISFTKTNKAKDLTDDSIILVPIHKHRNDLLEKHGISSSNVIVLEDVMNTLRIIRERFVCGPEFVSTDVEL